VVKVVEAVKVVKVEEATKAVVVNVHVRGVKKVL
tara:strand:+ start:306 stop:407 length:102 start_codon:yes stop_codon:yes gene_type:complete